MKRTLWYGIAAAILFALGGCATAPGQFNGLGGDVMSYLVVYRTDDGVLTKNEYDAVVRVAKKMAKHVGAQLSSPLEAGVSAGIPSGLGGAFDGAGASSAVIGFLSGLSAYSFAAVSAIAEATENALRDREQAVGESVFHMVHVAAAFVRSNNTSEAAAPPR